MERKRERERDGERERENRRKREGKGNFKRKGEVTGGGLLRNVEIKKKFVR